MCSFETTLTEDGARSLLESVVEPVPRTREFRMILHNRGMTRVALPAQHLCCDLRGREAQLRLTLTYTVRTGRIQVQTGAVIHDKCKDAMTELDKIYSIFLESGRLVKYARELKDVVQNLRSPAIWDSTSITMKADVKKELAVTPKEELPDDDNYYTAISHCAAYIQQGLYDYPDQRDCLLDVLVRQFGLEMYESFTHIDSDR